MKKTINVSEEYVIHGILEDTRSDINSMYKLSVFGVTSLIIAFFIVASIIIESQTHFIIAGCILMMLYVYSLLALKLQKSLQLGMLENVTKLNMEVKKDGPTKDGRNNEEEPFEEDYYGATKKGTTEVGT
jgi:hypothetical protein